MRHVAAFTRDQCSHYELRFDNSHPERSIFWTTRYLGAQGAWKNFEEFAT
jgi:hypothetical protein